MKKSIWIWIFLGALFPPLFFIPLVYYFIFKPLKNGVVEGGPIVFYSWGLFLSSLSLLANLPIRTISQAFKVLSNPHFALNYIYFSFIFSLFSIFCFYYSLRNDPDKNNILPLKKFMPDWKYILFIIFAFAPLLGLLSDKPIELKNIYHPFAYAIAVIFKANNKFAVLIGCLVISICTPIIEEIYYRGVLFKSFDQQSKFGKWAILTFSTLLFALSHLPVSFIFPLIFAILSNKFRLKTQNLIPIMIVHAIWNFNVLMITLIKLQ